MIITIYLNLQRIGFLSIQIFIVYDISFKKIVLNFFVSKILMHLKFSIYL